MIFIFYVGKVFEKNTKRSLQPAMPGPVIRVRDMTKFLINVKSYTI